MILFTCGLPSLLLRPASFWSFPSPIFADKLKTTFDQLASSARCRAGRFFQRPGWPESGCWPPCFLTPETVRPAEQEAEAEVRRLMFGVSAQAGSNPDED